MIIIAVIIFIIALAALIFASKWVIDAAIAISEYTGISQLAIGFILIAFSVSMPDFIVSVTATAIQKAPMAIGDVLGSSIANICLVLGVVTLMRKVRVERLHTIESAELLLLISIVPAVILSKGVVGPIEGMILLIVFCLYCFFIFKDKFSLNIREGVTKREWRRSIMLFLFGMIIVVASSQYVVGSAAEIAAFFGVSEAVIGLTLISFGTTLPELALDFTAIRKGQCALAIGDILGSTVVNLTLILGTVLVMSPIGGMALMSYTIPLAFIIIANTFLFYSMVKHEGIGHKQGIVFILLYVIFIITMLTTRIV
ncbi:MAG: sodium:calcium antiporter [Candidatus Aenigmarchaeota archaeon]|nr:sodium:calcium antiporter [Candidatus Aenigmarchaeota archaeon]